MLIRRMYINYRYYTLINVQSTVTEIISCSYNTTVNNTSIDILCYIIFILVTHSPPEFDTKTLLRVPTLFLVQIENLEFSTFEEPPEENSTLTTMSTTTYSADIENGNHGMPNEEEGKSCICIIHTY